MGWPDAMAVVGISWGLVVFFIFDRMMTIAENNK